MIDAVFVLPCSTNASIKCVTIDTGFGFPMATVVVRDSPANDLSTDTTIADVSVKQAITDIVAAPSTGRPLNRRTHEDWRSILGFVSPAAVTRTLRDSDLPVPAEPTGTRYLTFSPQAAASRHVRHSILHQSTSKNPPLTYVGEAIDTGIYPFPPKRTGGGRHTSTATPVQFCSTIASRGERKCTSCTARLSFLLVSSTTLRTSCAIPAR